MYAVTSTPLDKRTRATLRSAEFGFLGVVVYTLVQTPRRWGEPFSAGVLVLLNFELRPWRTSCWMVGTRRTSFVDELSSWRRPRPVHRTLQCYGPCGCANNPHDQVGSVPRSLKSSSRPAE